MCQCSADSARAPGRRTPLSLSLFALHFLHWESQAQHQLLQAAARWSASACGLTITRGLHRHYRHCAAQQVITLTTCRATCRVDRQVQLGIVAVSGLDSEGQAGQTLQGLSLRSHTCTQARAAGCTLAAAEAVLSYERHEGGKAGAHHCQAHDLATVQGRHAVPVGAAHDGVEQPLERPRGGPDVIPE